MPSPTNDQRFERSTDARPLPVYRVGAVVVAFGTVWVAYAQFPADVAVLRNAVGIIAGAAATLLGFLVSTGALLYAVSSTTLAQNLQRTGHFRNLLVDLFVDATCFLAALIVSLICLFLPEASTQPFFARPLTMGSLIMVFCNALAYLLLLPVGWKMWLLLSSIKPDTPGLR